MTTKRVIAYPMQESEWDRVSAEIQPTQRTDSYVIGDIDEDNLEGLRDQGVLVEEMPAGGQPTTAAQARGALSSSTGVRGWTPGNNESIPAPEPGVPTQWMVSMDGPLDADRRAAVDAVGSQFEEYVPSFSYVVTATPEQATELINLEFVLDVVRYGPTVTGPVTLTRVGAEPEAGTGDAVAPVPVRVWDVWLTDESAREQVVDWLDSEGIEVVGSGGRRVRFELEDGSDLADRVNALPGVLSMIEHVPPKLFNDVARVILGVTSQNPGEDLAYRGEGQIIAVADTGLEESHPDFQDRIVEVVALGRQGDASDPHGHGTHVAGSVLADGSASNGDFRGVAPKAQLYFQSIMDSRGGLGGLPVSLEDLFEPAYQAGARIHNNSWGAATASAYTVNSTDVDAYVSKRRDMLVVISAGNEGSAANRVNSASGFVDWLSIGSPASCKNALTVGAARNNRTTGGISGLTYGDAWSSKFPDPPIAEQKVSGDPECLAAFSSRGPCDDRRIKPDVVAPGTDVLSARSSTAPDENFWGLHPNPAYAYMGGTSMASPLVAGCAALVREYFVTERNIQPSAALLKATLINGTRWLSGADSVAEHELQPNYHQGFGEVFFPMTLPSGAEPDLRLEFVDAWQSPGLQFRETGRKIVFSVEVAAGLPLRLCMAYTDLPGRSLQNDLSFIVEDPTGRKFVGNADLPGNIHRSDVDNNVEVLRVDDPAPGRWRIHVFARNLLRGPQDFALVATGKLTSKVVRSPL